MIIVINNHNDKYVETISLESFEYIHENLKKYSVKKNEKNTKNKLNLLYTKEV